MTNNDIFWQLVKKHEPIVIAEVAQAHDGSLGNAYAYIDAVAKAGADVVKFQTHIADAESTIQEPWRIKFSLQDKTRYDYWKRMEFTEEQWKGLAEHAKRNNLIFLSSPFSFEAVEMLQRVGIQAWKVPSGEITNLPLIEYMAQTGKPMLLSSGMSSWDHLDNAVDIIRYYNAPLLIFQCTTSYPCSAEKIGLNVLEEIKSRYDCPVGLSDHSGAIYAGLAAAALGVQMIEVHVVFSHECFGPDTPASITIPDLHQLVEGADFIHRALSSPVNKNQVADEMEDMRNLFGKSIVFNRACEKGHCISRADISLKKPGTGVPSSRMRDFIGRMLIKPVQKGDFLKESDVET